jgi:hypothetical protein
MSLGDKMSYHAPHHLRNSCNFIAIIHHKELKQGQLVVRGLRFLVLIQLKKQLHITFAFALVHQLLK